MVLTERSVRPRWVLDSLRLRSPILPAAGVLGYGPEVARTVPLERLGAFVTAGIGVRTLRGSAPRLRETAAGVVYSAGGSSLGVRAALRKYAPAWAALPTPVIVNLVGERAEDFATCAAEIEGTEGVVALELNLVNPALEDDVRIVLARVQERCALPLIPKLSPTTPSLVGAIAGCAEGDAAAVTIGGGFPVAGGVLVGPATAPLVLAVVLRAVELGLLPIIAGGGVTKAEDARALLGAGAFAVQVGSAHLANPRAAVEIAEQIQHT